MNLKLETEFSKAGLLIEVDFLKKQIDNMRPLPGDTEGRVMQKLRLDWNYHSNAIEGNRLNYGETVAFLMEGITAKGKPLKDHLDIRGHNEAINFLLSVVKDTRPLSEADIRNLHKMVLVEPYDVKAQTADGLPTTKRITLGEYKALPNHVKTSTGEIHYYASPEETPAKMHELMEWYSEAANNTAIHPVVVAALFHHKFVAIHPFDDGNGRLSRILMNLILMQKGYPPVVIKNDDRQNYYALLSRADTGEYWPFIEYISDGLIGSLQLYLKAAMGNDIDEDEDIDKEIALFKMELESKIANQNEISAKGIYDICVEELLPLIHNLTKKARVFNDLFFKIENLLTVNYINLPENTKGSYSTIIDESNLITSFPFLSNNAYKIESIYLYIKLIRFKKENNTFDVTGSLMIRFGNYDYEIKNHNLELNITKPYGEKLIQQDKKEIETVILRDLKGLIKDNFRE